jgi:Flp pilus assembly protein TadG
MKRSRKGATLVEFAIAILLFMVLMAGILDWSLTFFIHQTLTWRVSEAVRYGAVYGIGTLDPATLTAVLDNNRVAQVKNKVLCGTLTCSGSSGIFGITAADVAVSMTTIPDTQIYTLNPVSRPHVVVTVSNYRISQFTPSFGRRFQGQPITVGRPQECNEPACDSY